MHTQVNSLNELFEKMYEIYTSNSPTKSYRADLAVDFISILTNQEERDNGERASTKFLWMEREAGTSLVGNNHPHHGAFTIFYRPEQENQRYHVIDMFNYSPTIREVSVKEVDALLHDWFGFT